MVTILKDSHLLQGKELRCLLCNGKINKGQRYYRNKTIKSTDIITGETRSTIEIEDASVMNSTFIITNRNDNNNFIEKLKHRDKAYVSPYTKFDRIRKRK